MTCVGHVEIESYAQKVLLKHWPKVPLMEDVRKVNGDEFGKVDLICGGFPCQDISVAGKQKGLKDEKGNTTRSGLYDEIIRITRICKPRYIVLENVAALLSRSDWFGYVLGRLAEIGYDAEWEIISAADVGAPHLRKRVWIVAYPKYGSDRTDRGAEKEESGIQEECRATGYPWLSGGTSSDKEILADSASERLQIGRQPRRKESGKKKSSRLEPKFKRCGENVADSDGHRSKTRLSKQEQREKGDSKITFNGNNRFGGRAKQNNWTIEPELGRVANGVPNRSHRLKCLGNALVPQIAEYIGKQIINSQ